MSNTPIIPALPTPFDSSGAFDRDAAVSHAEWLLQQGVDGLMPCGTTGEVALLGDDELIAGVGAAVAAAAGSAPVIAHVGRPSTAATIALGERALEAGATSVSAVVPYYFPLSTEAILAHYRSLMAALDPGRVIAYSIPSHSNNDLSADALGVLIEEGLAGFKDTTLSAERQRRYAAAAAASSRDDFRLLIGAGRLLLEALSGGANGAVLAIANVEPALCVAVRDAHVAGEAEEARRLQAQLTAAEDAVPTIPALKVAISELHAERGGLAYGASTRPPL